MELFFSEIFLSDTDLSTGISKLSKESGEREIKNPGLNSFSINF